MRLCASFAAVLDEVQSRSDQHGAGAVQHGVERRKKCRRNLHQAAGLVVRRFAIKNDSANITRVNSPSTAKLPLSERSVDADCGNSSARKRLGSVGQRIDPHQQANPQRRAGERKQRSREQPQRNQKQVDDGVKGLRGVHRPGDDEAQRGQRKRHQENGQHGQREARQREVHADERREDQEDQSLQRGQRRAAEALCPAQSPSGSRARPAPRAGSLPCGLRSPTSW